MHLIIFCLPLNHQINHSPKHLQAMTTQSITIEQMEEALLELGVFIGGLTPEGIEYYYQLLVGSFVSQTFGTCPKIETEIEPENKDYNGVWVRIATPKTPTDKTAYNCLGYFETFKLANAYSDFIFKTKGIETVFLPYNPITGK